MLVVRVPKPRYLDQLPIACRPGLLVVRVHKPRYPTRFEREREKREREREKEKRRER